MFNNNFKKAPKKLQIVFYGKQDITGPTKLDDKLAAVGGNETSYFTFAHCLLLIAHSPKFFIGYSSKDFILPLITCILYLFIAGAKNTNHN